MSRIGEIFHVKNWFQVVVVFALVGGCQSEIITEASDSEHFAKAYENGEQGHVYYINQLKNGNTIFLSSAPGGTVMRLVELDPLGKVLNESEIISELNVLTQGISTANGEHIVNAINQPYIIHLDASGKLINTSLYNDGFQGQPKVHGPAVEAQNGDLYISASTGNFAFESENSICRFDNEMVLQDTFSVADSLLPGQTKTFNLTAVMGNTYFAAGDCFVPGQGIFNTNHKVFFSKFQMNQDGAISGESGVIMNSEASNYDERLVGFTADREGGMLGVAASASWLFSDLQTRGGVDFKVYKVDSDLNLEWEKTINPGVLQIWPTRAKLLPGGNFAITGFCLVKGFAKESPFLVVLSPEGEIMISKTYVLGGSVILNTLFGEDNGDIWLGGTSASFGNRLEPRSAFVLKTNNKGEYQ